MMELLPRLDRRSAKSLTAEERRQYEQARVMSMKKWVDKYGMDSVEIDTIWINPVSVQMKGSPLNDLQLAQAVNRWYDNGFDYGYEIYFTPRMDAPDSMYDKLHRDWRLNAQGIYYKSHFTDECVKMGRSVWIPSYADLDWDSPSELDRRRRAQAFARHNVKNEAWNKTEFSWEVDAWSDVFAGMRDDPLLTIDKHQYFRHAHKTDPDLCSLTGEKHVIQRIPDATFGLAALSDCELDLSICASELRRSALERLLLHRKCGLVADPKWGDTDLLFPFMVYEAKGWNGDCREARHQACLAGATYLDMLDDLARMPGPTESTKPYQTKTSHQYQVFALTSFGAHWHLLVGYRRPRDEDEVRCDPGMSENVYMFQRIWSGRIVNEMQAWRLLALVDQIHLWAVTQHRTFVIEHLRAWHTFCADNYLLDWKSVYDLGASHKRKRSLSEDDNDGLPHWATLLDEMGKARVLDRARQDLDRVRRDNDKPKTDCSDPEAGEDRIIVCMMGPCLQVQPSFESHEQWLQHVQTEHSAETGEWNLSSLRRFLLHTPQPPEDDGNTQQPARQDSSRKRMKLRIEGGRDIASKRLSS